METGGGAALVAATTGWINTQSLAKNNAASGGGGGLPHTFDERAMVEIGRAYGAFGSGPPGGGGLAPPPIPWMSNALRRLRQGAVTVQRGEEEDNGASPVAMAMT